MAEIFLAKNVGAEGFEKDLVIKRILPHYSEDEEFVTMFIDEASIASKLAHANIVQIYDFDQVDGAFYIAMEYVNGKDLKDVIGDGLKKGKVLNPAQVVFIIIELAKALHYAHTKSFAGTPLNIVHRDVSPQNAMISFAGEVKLMDFGIAKAASRSTHTVAGTVKGKCAYMSPEQAKGKQLDGRSDAFALGVVAWEMLTGKRLFLAESDFMTLTNVLKQEAPPPSSLNPDVPPELDQILLKVLEKDRDNRYKDAQAFERALTKWFYTNADLDKAALAPYMEGMYATDIASNRAKQAQERTMFMVATGADDPGAAGNPPPSPDEATRMLSADSPDVQAMTTMMDGDMGADKVAELRALAEQAATGVDNDEATRVLGAMSDAPMNDQATRMMSAMSDVAPAPAPVASQQYGTYDYEVPPPASKAWMWMLAALVVLAIGGVAAWYFIVGPGAAPAAATPTEDKPVADKSDKPDKDETPAKDDKPADDDDDEDELEIVDDEPDKKPSGDDTKPAGEDKKPAGEDAKPGDTKVAEAKPDGATKPAGTPPAGTEPAGGDAKPAGGDAKPTTAGTQPAATGDAKPAGVDAKPAGVDAKPAGGDVAGGATAVAPPAAKKTTQILVQCNPAGQVSSNIGSPENQGMAWVIKDVPLGSVVKVKCYKQGYATQVQDVVAQHGVQLPFSLRKIATGYGKIVINAKPWAKCSVASKRNATTPVKISKVKAGKYRVVCKQGGQSKSAVIKVKPNKTATKFFKFKR